VLLGCKYKEKPAYYIPFREKKHLSSHDIRNSQHFLHQNAVPIDKLEVGKLVNSLAHKLTNLSTCKLTNLKTH